MPELVDLIDGVGEVVRVEAAEGTLLIVLEDCLRLNVVLKRELDLRAGEASEAGGSSIDAFRELVGTDSESQIHRKNSPSTELYGLQILPC